MVLRLPWNFFFVVLIFVMVVFHLSLIIWSRHMAVRLSRQWSHLLAFPDALKVDEDARDYNHDQGKPDDGKQTETAAG